MTVQKLMVSVEALYFDQHLFNGILKVYVRTVVYGFYYVTLF